MADNKDWPTTIDAAVRVLQGLLPEDEQRKIAAMAEDDLILMHFGLGAWIRNNLGLWQGNTALQNRHRRDGCRWRVQRHSQGPLAVPETGGAQTALTRGWIDGRMFVLYRWRTFILHRHAHP